MLNLVLGVLSGYVLNLLIIGINCRLGAFRLSRGACHISSLEKCNNPLQLTKQWCRPKTATWGAVLQDICGTRL